MKKRKNNGKGEREQKWEKNWKKEGKNKVIIIQICKQSNETKLKITEKKNRYFPVFTYVRTSVTTKFEL